MFDSRTQPSCCMEVESGLSNLLTFVTGLMTMMLNVRTSTLTCMVRGELGDFFMCQSLVQLRPFLARYFVSSIHLESWLQLFQFKQTVTFEGSVLVQTWIQDMLHKYLYYLPYVYRRFWFSAVPDRFNPSLKVHCDKLRSEDVLMMPGLTKPHRNL